MVRIEALTPDGRLLEPITRFHSVDFTLKLNEIGRGTIELPLPHDPRHFPEGSRFLVYRETPKVRAQIFANAEWVLQAVERDSDEGLLRLELADQNILLDHAIVGYTPGTPYADKTNEEWDAVPTPIDPDLRIDNIMRAYVRENLSDAVLENDDDTAEGLTRDNPLIAVEDDRSLADLGEHQAGFAKLHDTLVALARQSDEKGVPLFFRLVRRAGGSFIFRVWGNQPQIDRGKNSDRPVILQERVALTRVRERYDYSERVNVAYVLGETQGQGGGADRFYFLEYNLDSLRRGPFNRREAVYDLGDAREDEETWMRDQAKSFLNGHRPRIQLSAEVVDGGKFLYGRDYDFGYRVSVAIGDERLPQREFDAYVNAVRLNVDESGFEQVSISLSSTEFL